MRFDQAPCPNATLKDLDTRVLRAFAARASEAGSLRLSERDDTAGLLTQLDLLVDGLPTNAAVLLFGRKPERFVSSSIVRCTHSLGARVAKLLPATRVFRGGVFHLVDESVDYVVRALNLATTGRRQRAMESAGYQGIPREVVVEAIVNAVVHRDYIDDRGIEVSVIDDRLEVWNPGRLLPSLSIEKLRRPHDSVARNPLLARVCHLAGYTVRVGTGTRDMIMTCRGVGLPVPQFASSDGFMTSLWWRPNE